MNRQDAIDEEIEEHRDEDQHDRGTEESEAKPIIIDRRFSRGGINFCRNPSNEETGTNFNTSLEMQTEMDTDENVFHDEQDFQNVVDENMDHEIVDNFVDQNVQITKF